MRRLFSIICALIIASITTVLPFSLRATTVTDIYDVPSSTQISTGSNHLFTITIADAVAEGETLQIVFPSGYVLTSITEDDVDIADDGTDLSTQTDCSGVANEQASVSISSQTITITICAGDGGAIALGSVVTVEIGANASSYGSGTNRITNPSAVASYFINLTGTSGNSGSVIAMTTTAGGSSVSATVPGDTTTTGGGCDENEGDACTSAANSCGMTEAGVIGCAGYCDAVTPDETLCEESPSCVSNVGDACTSASNACGMTNEGIIDCEGSCSASAPLDNECGVDPVCNADYGASCVSSENSCGMTNSGSVGCDGVCSADAPSDDLCSVSPVCASNQGSACTSGSNSCGMTNSGTVACDGSCSASVPSNSSCPVGQCSAEYGDACVSPANSCAMTNTGSIGCDGVCSANTPSEDLCTDPSSSCVSTEGDACTSDPNSCGIVNSGTIACNGTCSASIPLESSCPAVACDPEREDCSAETPECVDDVCNVTDGSHGQGGEQTPSNAQQEVSILESLQDSTEVQAAVDIAVPIAAVAAVTTLAILASSFSLLPYLQWLFTSPFLFFARRKRKAFGVVYNAITKVAIDLATVRLYNATNGRLVRSTITDVQGTYAFHAAPGTYRIVVAKAGFVFPSVYLRDVKDDGAYHDVYSGQDIAVTDETATIAANIPLDPSDAAAHHAPRSLQIRRFLRATARIFAASGLIVSVVVSVLSPSMMTIGLAVGQCVIFLLFWRLAQPKRPRGWGIVFDAQSRKPVGNAVVRLFEPKYNKLVESTLTDSLGRYSFLVGPNEYVLRTSKEGYDEHTAAALDYRQNTEPSPLAVDVPLTPEKPL